MRALVFSTLLLTAPALGLVSGCSSQDHVSGGRDMEHEDVPESMAEAHYLEQRAMELISRGRAKRRTDRRKEFFERALGDLRDARMLYEEELIDDPGTPEKQRQLEAEIDRLDEVIATVHRDRPAK